MKPHWRIRRYEDRIVFTWVGSWLELYEDLSFRKLLNHTQPTLHYKRKPAGELSYVFEIK